MTPIDEILKKAKKSPTSKYNYMWETVDKTNEEIVTENKALRDKGKKFVEDTIKPYANDNPIKKNSKGMGALAEILSSTQANPLDEAIRRPGNTLNKAAGQIGERNLVAGGINALTAVGEVAALPFSALDYGMRQLPGGELGADILAYPFEKVGEFVAKAPEAIDNVIDYAAGKGTAEQLDEYLKLYMMIKGVISDDKQFEEIKQAFGGFNQLASQLLLAKGLHSASKPIAGKMGAKDFTSQSGRQASAELKTLREANQKLNAQSKPITEKISDADSKVIESLNPKNAKEKVKFSDENQKKNYEEQVEVAKAEKEARIEQQKQKAKQKKQSKKEKELAEKANKNKEKRTRKAREREKQIEKSNKQKDNRLYNRTRKAFQKAKAKGEPYSEAKIAKIAERVKDQNVKEKFETLFNEVLEYNQKPLKPETARGQQLQRGKTTRPMDEQIAGDYKFRTPEQQRVRERTKSQQVGDRIGLPKDSRLTETILSELNKGKTKRQVSKETGATPRQVDAVAKQSEQPRVGTEKKPSGKPVSEKASTPSKDRIVEPTEGEKSPSVFKTDQASAKNARTAKPVVKDNLTTKGEPETPQVGKPNLNKAIKNKSTDLIDIKEAEKLLEFDRNKEPLKSKDGKNRVKELEDAISKDGLEEPILIKYYQNEGKALITEGNHRVAALKNLGSDKVPVIIERVGGKAPTKAKKVKDFDVESLRNKYKGEIPSTLKAEDLGIKKAKTQFDTGKTQTKAKSKKKVDSSKQNNTAAIKRMLNERKSVDEIATALNVKESEVIRVRRETAPSPKELEFRAGGKEKDFTEYSPLINRVLELRDLKNDKTVGRGDKLRANKEIKELVAKIPNAQYDFVGNNLYLDFTKARRYTKAELTKLKDIEIENAEAKKPFKKLTDLEVDKQQFLAEMMEGNIDWFPSDLKNIIPKGFGKKKIDKGIKDIKKNAGAEQSKEAQVVRDFAKDLEDYIENYGEIKLTDGTRVSKEMILSELDDFIERKALEEGGKGDTSFNFGENVKKKQEKPTPIERTKAGDQYTFGAETKPEMSKQGLYKNKKGANEEGTPLFNQKKTDKAQIDAFENKSITKEKRGNEEVYRIRDKDGKVEAEFATKEGAEVYLEQKKSKSPIDNKVAEAKRNIIKKTMGRSPALIDPTLLKDYAVVGADYLRRGARTLREFYNKMKGDFGTDIKKHIRKIWDKVNEQYIKLANDTNEFRDAVKKFLPDKEKGETNFDPGKESLTEAIDRKLWDEFSRPKKYMKEANIPKGSKKDFYSVYETFVAKAQSKLDKTIDVLLNEKDGLIKRMTDDKISTVDVGLYLYAKHAKERNKVIKERNGREAGSGITDATADAILKSFEGNEKIDQYAKEFREKVIEPNLELLKESGRLSEKEYKNIKETYEHYVPLKGLEGLDALGEKVVGAKNISVTGKGTQRAKGLGEGNIPENPFLNAVLDYRNNIVHAEKNRIGQAFLEFTKDHHNPELYTVSKVGKVDLFDGDGTIKPTRKTSTNDNQVGVWVDGNYYKITLKDKPLLRAFKSLGGSRTIKIVNNANNYLRFVYTIGSPKFIFRNAQRDIQTAMINIGADYKGAAKEIAKNYSKAASGIYKEMRGKDGGEWGKLYQEYKDNGGLTSWLDLGDINTVAKRFDRDVKRLQEKGKIKAAGRKTLKFIEDINLATENAARLATYKELKNRFIKEGIPKDQAIKKAISEARKVTLDFNKKGEWGSVLNHVYLFSNAGLQGVWRLGKALKTRRGKQIFAGLTGSAAALNLYNRIINPEGYAQINEWDKDRKWIMAVPGTDQFITLHAPYGYNVANALGNSTADLIAGDIDGGKFLSRVASSFLDAVNIFGNSPTLPQLIAPTVADPFVQLMENKDFKNDQIYKEQNPFAPNRPDSEMYFKNVNPAAKGFTDFMSEYASVEVNPEYIEHLFTAYLGGIGSTAKDVSNLVGDAVNGEIPQVYNVPFLQDVVKTPFDYVDFRTIYRMHKESAKETFALKERKDFYNEISKAIKKGLMKKDQAKRLIKNFQRGQTEQKLK